MTLAHYRPGAALHRADGRTGQSRGTVHEPDCVLAGRAVAPQNVGLAVSVKVPDSRDAPGEIRLRGDLDAARERDAVHDPDHVLAGRFVAPQDVGLAVSVKVPDSDDAPVEIRLHRHQA